MKTINLPRENDNLKDMINNKLPCSRTWKRKELIKQISNKFIQLAKRKELLAFTREDLNSLFKDKLHTKVKQKAVTVLLSKMIESNLIKEDTVKIPVYRLRNKPLLSFDYGSYNVLMAKKGYKRTLYNRNGLKKSKVKTLGMSESVEDYNYDFSEIDSHKPQQRQRVITNSPKSVVRELAYIKEKKVYTILQ